jgi:uncharacterized membrane protein
MDQLVLLSLRIIHVGAGLFWVGAVLVVGLFILPASRNAGASGQQLLIDIMMKRRLAAYIPVAAVLTTLAGLILFWRNESLSAGAWSRSPMGMGMSVGAAAAILASVVGMGISGPAGKKLALAGASGSSGPALSAEERASLQKRAALGSVWSMILLIIATLAMAIARYL